MSALAIELPKLFFTAGETVSGKIVFKPKVDRRIHGVHIHFSGFEFCENNILSDIPFQKKWILDGATTLFGNKCVINRAGHQTTTHRHSESEGVLIKAGDYAWPFSFQIPKNIPPSCEYKGGKVKIDYSITTLVDIPWAKSIRCIQHIRVGLPYVVDPERAPQLLSEEKSFLIHHRVEDGTNRAHTLKLEGWVDKPVTYSGDKITIHCCLTNNSGRHVQSLKIKLKQLWSYGTGYFEKYTITKVKHKDRKFPFASGTYETDVAMVVPNCDLRPTIQNASLIRVSYHITVIGTIRAGGALRLRIPLIVASYPPVQKGGLTPKTARKAPVKKSEGDKKEEEAEEAEINPEPILIDWDAPVPGQQANTGQFLAEPLMPMNLTTSPPLDGGQSTPKRPVLNPADFSVDTDAFDFFDEVKPSQIHLDDLAVNSCVMEIQNHVTELDSAIQWASSGQLEHAVEVDPSLTSAAAQDALSSSAKSVSAAISQLVEAAKKADQKVYTDAVKMLSATVTTLAHDAKMTAYHVHDPNAQQTILQQAKLISLGTQQLSLQGKEIVTYDPFSSVYSQDFMIGTMEKTAKSTMDNCADLAEFTGQALLESNAKANQLKEEHDRITKALDAFNNPFGDANEKATIEELEKGAQAFGAAASQLAVATRGTSEEISKAASGFTQVTRHLFKDVKGIAKSNRAISQALFEATKAAGVAALHLVDACNNGVRSGDTSSKEIMDSVRANHEQASRIIGLVRADQKRKLQELEAQQSKVELQAETEKQQKEQQEREKDMKEKVALEDSAQSELEKAVAAIAAAADKMRVALEAASKKSQMQSDNLFEPHHIDHKFDVIYASGSVAKAITELLRAAAIAQGERAKSARDTQPDSVYHKDPAWTQGLISAAKTVVLLIERLVQATSEKELDEEMIVSIARAISAATAQLMSAERAKGVLDSDAHRKLSEAARLVANTTSELVHKIKDAADHTPDQPGAQEQSDDSATGARVKELEAAAQIAKLEKELEKARVGMASLRKAKYQA